MREPQLSVSARQPEARLRDAEALIRIRGLVEAAYVNPGLEFDSLRKIGDLTGARFNG
jgi:hypothetical protein